MEESRIKNVFIEKRRGKHSFYTKNLVPGNKVYDERLVREKGVEYREWNPERSKVGAAVAKGSQNIHIKSGDTVLYLGSATGTTASHISDIVGKSGIIFGIDFAPRVVREFVFLSEIRENLIPILGDCHKPESYCDRILESDVIIQDIAQKDQVGIFRKNLQFLKKGGYGLLTIKARSIDVSQKPRKIFNQVKGELEKFIKIEEFLILEPFEKDHCLFVVRK